MQSPPVPRYLVPLRSKYSPQHLILKHPQLPFLPQCQRPSFTTILNNRQDYSFINFTKCPKYKNATKIRSRPLPFGQMDRQADITKPVVAYSTYLQNSLKASKISFLIVVGLSGISQGETQSSEMVAQPFPEISCACAIQISGAVQTFAATSCAPPWYFLSKDTASIEASFTDRIRRSGDKQTQAVYKQFFLTGYWTFWAQL